MRQRNLGRIPKISTLAMLALLAAGCGNSEASNGISPDVNAPEDAAVDDVLGANDNAANAADDSSQQR
jgi:hypothetical protein